MQPLFYKFWENIADSFRRKNLKYHLLAIAATYFLVVSGFDWKYFSFFVGTPLSYALFSAALMGFIIPFLVPIALLIFGKIYKNLKLLNTGFALGQAAMLGYFISSAYKVFTGRWAPPLNHLGNKFLDMTQLNHATSALPDTSRIFQFGFLRGGIFWGWPSTHTTVAFAMAFTLCVLYTKNKLLCTIAILYAFYIGFGVSMTIHWFSDAVAGAILGTVIGLVIGKTFKQREKSLGLA